MLATAFTIDGPVSIRYPRGNGLGVALDDPAPLPVGKSELLTQGKDGLVIAVGTRCHDALQAVETLLAETDRAFTLLNLRFVKPLDEAAILANLKKGKPLVVVEEGSVQGGIGEQIVALASHSGWHGPVAQIAMPDSFPEQGSQAEILRDLGLDADAIANRLREL